jgi:hypothetical protein
MRRSLTLTLALACGLLLAAPALASTNSQIYDECQNGAITGKYTQAQLERALKNLPSDLDQYTDCRSIIERAQLDRAGGSHGAHGGGGGGAGSGTGGTGGSAGPTGPTGGSGPSRNPLSGATAAERKAYDTAAKTGAAPVALDGGPTISPSAAGVRNAGRAGHDLPASVLVLLALAAAVLVGGGGRMTFNRVRARGAG